jgi:GNAT superfamily N-acetyltransferase
MNLRAVLLAAVSSFILGGLWYSSALFGRAWKTANNEPKQDAWVRGLYVRPEYRGRGVDRMLPLGSRTRSAKSRFRCALCGDHADRAPGASQGMESDPPPRP